MFHLKIHIIDSIVDCTARPYIEPPRKDPKAAEIKERLAFVVGRANVRKEATLIELQWVPQCGRPIIILVLVEYPIARRLCERREQPDRPG
jgi:hypothetical protein